LRWIGQPLILMNALQLHGFDNSVAQLEAQGLSLVFGAYAMNCPSDDIMEVGFNPNSGYVYIALENGVSICSNLGQRVEYLVTDFETGEEYFFDDYEEALNSL
jgi:hypothetical protein